VRRRSFLAALAGSGLSGHFANAQPSKRVGVVLQGGAHFAGLSGVRDALQAAGLANIGIIVREGKGELRAIETAAWELENAGVDVIVAFAGSVAVATQRSTSRVPIVFVSGSDPVAFGLVESIARPGGRITGVQSLFSDVTSKRLALLQELLPGLRRVISFYSPENIIGSRAVQVASDAAQTLGLDFVAQATRSPEEIQARISTLGSEQADAYFFVPDSLVLAHDQMLLDAASVLRLPVMSHELDIVLRGALAGYGVNYRELGRQAGDYVVRILMGTPARDLPVQSVTRVALSINLKTARALGLTIPPTLLARADEVIE
jgi:putative tryptophan/tyrosine transport system substrate-binding protein